MKTEVYSWRLSADLKSDLEREARRRKMSLSSLLDLAAQDCLDKSGNLGDDAEQRRLHRAASAAVGTIESGNAKRSENTGRRVRETLQRRYGR
jgi:hypothetical protein